MNYMNYIDLITTYLANRQQTVFYGNSFSDPSTCPSGVPQWSILGPLLFIIYINNLPDIIDNVSCLIFADDVKLYKSINMETADLDVLCLQNNIDNLLQWCITWRLSLSSEKTHAVEFCRKSSTVRDQRQKSSYSYHIDGNIINVETITDLGVAFNKHLSFDQHIMQIILKACRAQIMIAKCFKFTDSKCKILLYVTFMRSLLEYTSVVWNTNSKKYITTLEKIQHTATHQVTNCRDLSYNDRLMLCKLHSLESHRKMKDYQFIHNSLYNKDFSPNCKELKMKITDSDRNKGNFIQCWPGSKLSKRNINQHVIDGWNKLPNYIKQMDSGKNFILELRKLFAYGNNH